MIQKLKIGRNNVLMKRCRLFLLTLTFARHLNTFKVLKYLFLEILDGFRIFIINKNLDSDVNHLFSAPLTE